jgi:hypothetical protein
MPFTQNSDMIQPYKSSIAPQRRPCTMNSGTKEHTKGSAATSSNSAKIMPPMSLLRPHVPADLHHRSNQWTRSACQLPTKTTQWQPPLLKLNIMQSCQTNRRQSVDHTARTSLWLTADFWTSTPSWQQILCFHTDNGLKSHGSSPSSKSKFTKPRYQRWI